MNTNILRYVILPYVPCMNIINAVEAFDIKDNETIDFIYGMYNIKPSKSSVSDKIEELYRYTKYLCINCNSNRGFIKKFIPRDIRLCNKCYNNPKYNLIHKNIAMSEYGVSETILQKLEHSTPTRMSPMIFYREEDIIGAVPEFSL